LVTFDHVREILELTINKESKILVIGCGNAPFSQDLYSNGYTNVVNIDTSEVVVSQQREKFPEMEWSVMDVREMDFEDGEFDLVVDKSVLDCLLCYSDAKINTLAMLKEVERVMRVDGMYMVVSLHSVEDVLRHVDNPSAFAWTVSSYRILNPRWDEGENSKRWDIL